ncbi:TniQ family protein [Nonomuraea sp. KM90]|uniref:TniQ family protein n=1 Tax=Nonomuraea sp. KM90 TaxID=3457428 RepID=UPI003FCDE1C1
MTRPRLLPVPLAPLPNELIGSYLNRLADANRLPIRRIDALIATGRHHSRDKDDLTGWTLSSIERLAALTGRNSPALIHALPSLAALAQPNPLPTPPASLTPTAWKTKVCQLCAASRGVHGLAVQRTYPHQRICLQHQRWLGGRQLPISPRFHELIRANIRHRRLLRGHRDPLQPSALHDEARTMTSRWFSNNNGPLELQRTWDDRLQMLNPDTESDPHDDRNLIEMVTYPETVVLTTLLSKPHNPVHHDFLAEVIRSFGLDPRSLPALHRHTTLPSSMRNPDTPSHPSRHRPGSKSTA